MDDLEHLAHDRCPFCGGEWGLPRAAGDDWVVVDCTMCEAMKTTASDPVPGHGQGPPAR